MMGHGRVGSQSANSAFPSGRDGLMVLLADKNRSTSRLLWMLIWLMNKEEELGSDEHDP